MADKITFLSWNVRGLGDANKRFAVFRFVANHMPAIILLQETHLTGDTIRHLRRRWVGWECHSVHSGYSRGVSILVHRGIPFECLDKEVDEEGRFICIYCKIYQLHYVFITVYVPPPYNCSVLKRVLPFLTKYPNVPGIILGDYNTIVEPHWDRVNSTAQPPINTLTPFGRMIAELGLMDIWRSKHLGVRQYSCHSSTYNSLSRIDMAIGNPLACQLTTCVKYLPRTMSDHSPLLLQIKIPNSSPGLGKPWRLNPFWLNIIDHSQILTGLTDYFLFNSGSADLNVEWDAMKASLRGVLIQQISRTKARRGQLEKALQARVQETESQCITDHNPNTVKNWREAQEQFTAFLLESAANKRLFLKQSYFEEGEKAGHLLASIANAPKG